MSYIHHLFRNNELLGLQLSSLHNLTFYLSLMEEVKKRIAEDTFHKWYEEKAQILDTKI